MLRVALFAVAARTAAAEANSSATVLDARVCAFDRIHINWTLAAPPRDAHLALYETTPVIGKDAPRPRAKVPLPLPPLPPVDADLPRELHDLSGGVAAEPVLTSMRWDADSWTMTLEFEHPTNAPPIENVRDFDRLVTTNIELRALTASWEAGGQHLALRINAPGDADAVQEAFDAKSFWAACAPWPPPPTHPHILSGVASVRVPVASRYAVGLVNGGIIEAAAGTVVVEFCDDAVIRDMDRVNEAQAPEVDDDDVWLELGGIYASTGHQHVSLPPEELPLTALGDWGLEFWLYVEDEPTGAHRGLFFKGDVDRLGGQRTPSAWLAADSNRVALRVSTDKGLDVGADTDVPLPLRKWTHLQFGFHNLSHSDNVKYLLTLDVDGARDATLEIFDPVTWNDGPLQLFRDPDRAGARGFVADVIVRARAPTRENAQWHYATARRVDRPDLRTHVAEPVDALVMADDPWAAALLTTEACAPYAERVAAYEAAPSRADASRVAAEILLFGAERLATGPKRCEGDAPPPLDAAAVQRGVAHLERAVSLGDAAAARMLAALTLAGFTSRDGNLKAIAPPSQRTVVVASSIGDAVHNNTQQAVRLLLIAASRGDARACLALSGRYRFGRGLSQSREASAWYAKCAAVVARDEFHTPGEQTFVELNRLTDETVDDGSVDDNQRGDEDAQLQAQMQRAEEGDVDACVASGDLLYWGARGFQRDHERARRFFKTAADADHAHARCLYASMLLRGEGGDTDHGEAVQQWRAVLESTTCVILASNR